MQRDLRTALVGMTVMAVSLAIGRFLLTPLMPLMQADAGLHLVTGGWLASVNNFGYLAGALFCVLWPLRALPTLRAGLLAVAAGTLGMGLVGGTVPWLLWRAVAGVASAALVVHGIAWSTTRLAAAGRTGLDVLVYAGVGIGIVVGGVTVAGLQPLGVTSAVFWMVFGIVSVLATAMLWRPLQAPVPRTVALAGAANVPSGPAWSLLLAYGLLGFGYVIPATFLPLIADGQLHLPALREWFWPLYGAATVAMTLAVPWLPARIGNRTALAGCCAAMALGVVLCLTWPTVAGLSLATVLLGAPMMPTVMFVMRESRLLAPRDPTRLIAAMTVSIGIGQIVGPPVAAWLAHRQGGFEAPMLLAGVAFAASLALCLVRSRAPVAGRQAPPERAPHSLSAPVHCTTGAGARG
jgi:MFS family permease